MQNRPPLLIGAAGSNGAGAITATGARVGDLVSPVQITGANPAANTFEPVVSVNDQVQQLSASNLSGNTYFFLLTPQGWKSLQ